MSRSEIKKKKKIKRKVIVLVSESRGRVESVTLKQHSDIYQDIVMENREIISSFFDIENNLFLSQKSNVNGYW